MAVFRGSSLPRASEVTWAGLTTRRLCHITLTRQEWMGLIDALDDLPTIADACRTPLEWLRGRIDGLPPRSDEPVTISLPPLEWSPLAIGLAIHVFTRPGLVDLAERLRSQMMAQAKLLESPVDLDCSEDIRRWPAAPDGSLGGRIGLN